MLRAAQKIGMTVLITLYCHEAPNRNKCRSRGLVPPGIHDSTEGQKIPHLGLGQGGAPARVSRVRYAKECASSAEYGTTYVSSSCQKFPDKFVRRATPIKMTPPGCAKTGGAKESSYATQLDTSCPDPATIEI